MYGEIPCARCLTGHEFDEYEKNTGLLIVDVFKDRDYEAVPAVLCKNHGPFTWGKDGHEAVHNAVVLEEVAKMAAVQNRSIREFSRHRRNSRISIIIASMVPTHIMDRGK